MSVQLLDKTRKLTSCSTIIIQIWLFLMIFVMYLAIFLSPNILVISKKGKVLGIKNRAGIEMIKELISNSVGGHIDALLNERLLNILSTKENVNLTTLGFDSENISQYEAIITPIDIAGERLGTLFIYRYQRPFEIDDIILSEYGTTVVGLEMLRSVNEESAEETEKYRL